MKRGVSLYSYQQSRFFKEMDLEAEIREVATGLDGADGIEIVDEMSLRYPDPGEAFVRQWFGWMERHGTRPVTMDVGMDVLQFRDHVMTHDECAERLRHDLRLAKRLGFANVRVLSVVPLDVMLKALPLAEQLDIRLGKEIHQPMALEGPQVTEIIEAAQRLGSTHLGIVPDFGIFGTRPCQPLLDWYERRGASPQASALALRLAALLKQGGWTYSLADVQKHTAGNLRAGWRRHVRGETVDEALLPVFREVRALAQVEIAQPSELDLVVVGEALLLSDTRADTLRQLAPHVVSVHAKFYDMTEVPGRPGQYEDVSIDTAAAVAALKAGGYTGYLDTEYEGQRYFQDRSRAEMRSEVDQVRRHQEMLRRLIAA